MKESDEVLFAIEAAFPQDVEADYVADPSIRNLYRVQICRFRRRQSESGLDKADDALLDALEKLWKNNYSTSTKLDKNWPAYRKIHYMVTVRGYSVRQACLKVAKERGGNWGINTRTTRLSSKRSSRLML